jgi:hypothetical protein
VRELADVSMNSEKQFSHKLYFFTGGILLIVLHSDGKVSRLRGVSHRWYRQIWTPNRALISRRPRDVTCNALLSSS